MIELYADNEYNTHNEEGTFNTPISTCRRCLKSIDGNCNYDWKCDKGSLFESIVDVKLQTIDGLEDRKAHLKRKNKINFRIILLPKQ